MHKQYRALSHICQLFTTYNFLNPLRYGIDFVRRVYLENVGLLEISYDLYPLIVITLITTPIATILFRKKLN